MKRLLFLLILLSPLATLATSTEGAVNRNLLIDGNVMQGAIPGVNNSSWETNEVFPGYLGEVSWFLTWDENNLYIGRIGGNNAAASVLYLRAEYPGSQGFSNRGKDFDGLNPEVSPLGGINFSLMLKNGYDEFSTWDGGLNDWSAENYSLNPFFSTQANGANMEVAIPWSAITGGNGKPLNIRALLYQYDSVSVDCNAQSPNPKIFGQSPWGTGNPGDGPNIGVNDGSPVSPAQPGGCGSGASQVTRWWGCYPVMAGVGPNNWLALSPEAGPSQFFCRKDSLTLAGNNPAATAIGTWSLALKPFGAPDPLIVSPNNANSVVRGLTGYGTYAFEWNFSYRSCQTNPDTVWITRYQPPPAANAGQDTVLACGATEAILFSNGIPQGASGQGIWSTIVGTGRVVSAQDTITQVTNLSYGINQFVWQLSNGPCPISSDTVSLMLFQQPFAAAGNDQLLCNEDSTDLIANPPDLIQKTAIGIWNLLSGPPGASIANVNASSTSFHFSGAGSWQMSWTISNGNCETVTDTITISNFDSTYAFAGLNIDTCNAETVYLTANDPAQVGNTASGYWAQLNGPVPLTFDNPDSNRISVSGLVSGDFLLTWNVSNGNCPISTDTLAISVGGPASNGIEIIVHSQAQSPTGGVTLGIPTGGLPPYFYSLNGIDFVMNRDFNHLAQGNYTAWIKDAQGCAVSLDFSIPVIFFIPSGISPNGDNLNDYLQIPGIDKYPNAVMEIYGQWGQLIFKSEPGYPQPWDGTFKGKPLAVATYYYILDLGVEALTPIKGSVTILK